MLFPQGGGTGQLGMSRVPSIADIIGAVNAQRPMIPNAPPAPGTVPGQIYPGAPPNPDFHRFGPGSMFLGPVPNIAPQGLRAPLFGR